jgi:hypothetical protein
LETAAPAGVPHDFIEIDRFDLQLYFAGGDAAEIEQFICHLGFELDVTLHHREIFANIGPKAGILLQRGQGRTIIQMRTNNEARK